MLAAIVLAAGAGTRYSEQPGVKLLARLDGRPMLEGVLATLRGQHLVRTVVVLGHSADEIEAVIPWASEIRVRNPHPEEGIASSLRVGFGELESGFEVDGAYVVLADQPRLRA